MTFSATFPTAAQLSPELAAGLGEIALEPPAADTRQAFLRFRLGQDWALLPLVQATEIVQLSPTEILPVPTMPDWVLGVQNWRGEMLWAIDLSRMVGFEPICGEVVGQADIKAIVVNVAGQQLGMVVKDVRDIELYDEDLLQPAVSGLFPDRLLPWLGGYFVDGGPVVDARTFKSISLSF